jgi:hypothetical protein
MHETPVTYDKATYDKAQLLALAEAADAPLDALRAVTNELRLLERVHGVLVGTACGDVAVRADADRLRLPSAASADSDVIGPTR